MGRRVLITFLVLALCEASRAQEWGYNSPIGPNDWSTISPDYSECGDGSMQSPINIIAADSTVDDISGLFFFQTNASRNGRLANDGHTVTFVADNPNDLTAPSINLVHENTAFFPGRMAGILYHLNNVDFHWGSTDAQGSEHFINGMGTAGEVHFIYFNRNYNTFENATSKSDGLIIIALRLEVCTNSDFDTIFGSNNEYLGMLSDNSSITTVINWRLDDLHECLEFRFGVCREQFYVYFGSLTTPACEQSVLWWVSTKNRCITRQQLDMLRMQRVSMDGPLLVNNFRPLQDTNGREVLLTGSQVSY